MAENPYQSPLARSPTEQPPLAPSWRRIVSLPLIVFGAFFISSAFVILFLLIRHGPSEFGFLICILGFYIGAGLLLAGLWLRRLK
jgi:hypothetical protein